MIILASKAELEAAWERVGYQGYTKPVVPDTVEETRDQFVAAFIEGYKCARGLPASAVIDFK